MWGGGSVDKRHLEHNLVWPLPHVFLPFDRIVDQNCQSNAQEEGTQASLRLNSPKGYSVCPVFEEVLIPHIEVAALSDPLNLVHPYSGPYTMW